MTKPRRPSHDRLPRLRARTAAADAVPTISCATAAAAEALRTGVLPAHLVRRCEIPREDETIRAGDPDDRALSNEYVGEETPGGTAQTPDQNVLDAIGRAYGLQDEDNGSLRSAFEVLARRDRRRFELVPPGRRSA